MTKTGSSDSQPVKLPLPPGQAIIFDLIAGRVYVGPVPAWGQR